jgi:glutamate-ammonia-ligase adenylyltransferase
LPVSTWFARLAQRYIAALTALTAEGRLYDVDMRLRPSGNQGPVAVHFDTFTEYHREHSWTWERMALTRARVVAGPQHFCAQVTATISELLSRPAAISRLKSDALEMRRKLEAQFPARTCWDLKFTAGGLVDIEFVVQVLQLCHPGVPGLRDQDTIAAAGKLTDAALIAPADGLALVAAARLQQDLTQVLRIAVDGEFHPEKATAGLRSLLARVAGVPDFARLESLLLQRQAAARAVFVRIISAAS